MTTLVHLVRMLKARAVRVAVGRWLCGVEGGMVRVRAAKRDSRLRGMLTAQWQEAPSGSQIMPEPASAMPVVASLIEGTLAHSFTGQPLSKSAARPAGYATDPNET